MTLNITDDGPQVETLGQRVDALQADFLGAFPPEGNEALDLSPDSYTGRETQILGEQFVELQNLLLQFVDLLDPSTATGTWVDFHLSLQATRRKPATRSTIPATVYGLPGTIIGDRRVLYSPNGSVWRTPAGLVIGPTGITPTTLTADATGPISALNTGTASWTIVDVTAGWDAVESSADARRGTTVESDEQGRARAQRTAPGIGAGTFPALIKALWEVPGVVDVGINNNRGLLPDSNGVPGKSFEAVVEGGTDEDVGLAIARTLNGSAGLFGSTAITVTLEVELEDGRVVEQPVNVRFTRVSFVDVIARYTIAFGVPGNAPSNVADLAKSVGAAYINGSGRGTDVVPTASGSAIVAALPPNSEPTITTLVARKGDPLGAATLLINTRQRARINPQPQPASVQSTNTQPFNFDVTWVLVLEADGVTAIVTFSSADFDVVSAASALEIANVINTQVDAVTASSNEGALLIETKTVGASSSLVIAAGTTNALLVELGLSLGSVSGSDGDIEVVVV